MDENIDALSAQLSQLHLGFGTRATRPSIFNLNQPASFTQTSRKPRPADEHRLSYLSLPGEIRNQIMQYALVPGFIHLPAPTLYKAGQSELGPLSELKLRPPRSNAPPLPVSNNRKRKRSSASNSPLPDPDLRGHFYPPKPVKRTQESLKIARSWYKGRRKPSWSLLATCKQAYSEGCWFLYGCNRLRLASGDLRNSLLHLQKIPRSNINLMRRVYLSLSLADLDSDVLSYIKYEHELYRFSSTPTSARPHTQRRQILHTLRNIWASKLAYLRGFTDLEYLTISFDFPDVAENRRAWLSRGIFCNALMVRGRHVAEAFKNIAPIRTLPQLSNGGLIGYDNVDGYYTGWNREIMFWICMALRRCDVLLKDNLAERDIDTLDPWTQGLCGRLGDREGCAGGLVLRILGRDPFPSIVRV